MRQILTAILISAPALGAQVARRADSLFVGGYAAPRTRERELTRPSTVDHEVRLALDSISASDRRGSIWIGAVLGIAAGASAAYYLVAVPRVRAIEHRSDGGPLEQLDYLVDPIIGGVIGGVVGVIAGAYIH